MGVMGGGENFRDFCVDRLREGVDTVHYVGCELNIRYIICLTRILSCMFSGLVPGVDAPGMLAPEFEAPASSLDG